MYILSVECFYKRFIAIWIWMGFEYCGVGLVQYGCSDDDDDSDLDWTWSEDEESGENAKSYEMLDTGDLSAAWRHLISMPLSFEEASVEKMKSAEIREENECSGCEGINPEHAGKKGGVLEAPLRGSTEVAQSSSGGSDMTEWETAQSCNSEGEIPFFEGSHKSKEDRSHPKRLGKNRGVKCDGPGRKKSTFPIHIQLESELLCLSEGGLMNVDMPEICVPSERAKQVQPMNMDGTIPLHVHGSYNTHPEISYTGSNRMFFSSNGIRNRESETQKIQTITKRASFAGRWKRMKQELRSWILPQCLCPNETCVHPSKSQGRYQGSKSQITKQNSTGAFNSTKSLKGYCRRQQYLVDRIEQSIV